MFAAVAVFASCNKDVIKDPEKMGSFSLDLSYEGEYRTKVTIPEVNVDDFYVTLERPLDGYIKIFKFSELKTQIENEGGVPLVPGHYTITAESPAAAPAAFDQPVFKGSSSFDVMTGEVTSVTVVCTLQNMVVTIEPTASFTNELVDYTVVVDNGIGTLTWSKADVESGLAGYFSVAPLHVHVDGFRFIDDKAPAAVFDGDISNVAAKDHHHIILDAVNTGAVGGIDIVVDYSTNDIFAGFEVPGFPEEGVPGGDEGIGGDDDENEDQKPEGLDGLKLDWEANPKKDIYELKSAYAKNEVLLQIYSKYGIEGFLVKIASPLESFIGTVESMMGGYKVSEDGTDYVVLDMMDQDVADKMSAIGLTAGDDLKGADKTVPFPLDGLLPMIIPFGPEVGSVHTFVMEVTDANGQILKETLKFQYKGN